MTEAASPDALLTGQRLQQAIASLPAGWRLEGNALTRVYDTTGWKATLMLAGALGHVCEAAWHHPELTLSFGAVKVALWTHTAGGVTARDVALARQIEAVALWRPDDGVLEGAPPAHAVVKAES
ncbi:4a-hydroxytetrahydrobiopterin dehydratase [Camelimonas abortus]|uniref:4a-hydroxytetrahydrobiopterin dehydratase n=1 Tax=Camelimonas abortus TaxID=1017184 RepID=A0ABV7LG76_9HYPH